MKGLVQFIADLRNARARDAEEKRVNAELANIRQKFRDPNISGYNRKKYVAKLLYMYILGYDIDFGYVESTALLGSHRYSEKQMGYLATTLMLTENDRLLDMVVNSIRKDLESLNDLHTCLALGCVATVGARTVGDALVNDVFKLLISPTSTAYVRKRAALTMLKLYRQDPSIMMPSWPDRVIALVDNPDLGVCTSALSLVTAIARDNPQSCQAVYGRVVRRLDRIVFDHEYGRDYVYYDVACPWLLVKMMRLLQLFPPPQDETIATTLKRVIGSVVEDGVGGVRQTVTGNSTGSGPGANGNGSSGGNGNGNGGKNTAKSTQRDNARNSILFEAINLAVHIDADPALMRDLVESLASFFTTAETNVLYLSLSAMATLAARYDPAPVKKYIPKVLPFLRDRDISVRRKTIDLLYALCDANSVKTIVGELLKYLQHAEYAMREEMAVRIAVLAEKYATVYSWYVDTALKLIAYAGNHVSDEVWQRVVQIVVNNENLQVYAAKTVFDYLKSLPGSDDSMLKVAGYILGEYGHLIAHEKGYEPLDQFLVLHDRFPTASPFTKGLLLTTYIKFVNLFKEIKPQLLQVFEFYATSIDAELQQRACEYLRLANSPNPDLLAIVWDEMPPFPERASALLSRVKEQPQLLPRRETSDFMVPQPTGAAGRSGSAVSAHSTGAGAAAAAGAGAKPPLPAPRKLSASPANGTAPSSLLTSGWEVPFRTFLTKNEGVFYEDSLMRIGIKSEYRRHLGCVILYFKNISSAPLDSLSVEVHSPSENLAVQTKNFPQSHLAPGALTEQVIIANAKGPFAEPPVIKVTYMAGTLKILNLKLPVVLEKFMEPASLTGDEFFRRWNQIGAGSRETQKIFKNASHTRSYKLTDDAAVVDGLHWSVLPGVDPKRENVVGASVLHTSVEGNFGCLIRLEPDADRVMFRVTVRATDDRIAGILVHNLVSAYQL